VRAGWANLSCGGQEAEAVGRTDEPFISDHDRMVRFEREAQLLASWNLPNSGAIYGLEESSSMRFLVMELVEGPTLAVALTNRKS
jgi:serine/threonine protein kinase